MMLHMQCALVGFPENPVLTSPSPLTAQVSLDLRDHPNKTATGRPSTETQYVLKQRFWIIANRGSHSYIHDHSANLGKLLILSEIQCSQLLHYEIIYIKLSL